jgi:hypothetical protein
MNIDDCSARTAFRTTNDTWREPGRATTWHTQTRGSESAGCAALPPQPFEGDRYAVEDTRVDEIALNYLARLPVAFA